MVVRELPAGTVTLLFTDVEGSTRLLQELGRERYVRALTEHRRLLRDAFRAHGGVEVDMQGDSFHFAFASAREAVLAAAAGQRALAEHAWPDAPIRVRIGLHTGEPVQAEGLYAGLDVHRAARVMSVAHGGQVVLSERTADLVADELPEGAWLLDLGEQRLKDLSRPQRLFQLVAAGLETEFPPLKTLENRPTNLPVAFTSLVGREAELVEVGALLRRPETRLLTLTGPAGTGKTRLALHVAGESIDAFPDGAFVAFLAAVPDAPSLLPSVAHALGVQSEPGRPPADALAAYLAARNVLLVLDNLEHLLDSGPDVSLLLRAAPGLTILATSRSRLNLSPERVYPVSPLALPSTRGGSGVEALAQSAAVRLFVERAGAVDPHFRLTEENADAVCRICAGADGLPLAIELAAARVATLPVDALAKRLGRRLQVLTGGPRDADRRQQTLRSAIAWSHELLTADEKALFARLGAFAAGCRLDDAEAVANADDDLETELVDGLGSLVEKSLLRRGDDPDGEPRYSMLETIREYALEQLAAGGGDRFHDLHADRFLAVAERLAPRRGGTEALARCDVELANLRAAFGRLLDRGRGRDALRLAAALWWFFLVRGLWTEGRRWLDEALAAADDDDPARREALDGGSYLAYLQGDLDRAEEHAHALVALGARAGDPLARAMGLNELSLAAARRGRLDSAESFARASLEAADGDSFARYPLGNLGAIAFLRGSYAEARTFLEQSIAIRRDGPGERDLGADLGLLALVAVLEGRVGEGAGLLADVLRLAVELDDDWVLASRALEGTAALLAFEGDVEAAAMLVSAADDVYRELTGSDEPPPLARHLRGEVAARGAAVDAGAAPERRPALDEVVAYALQRLGAVSGEEGASARHGPPGAALPRARPSRS